MLKITPAEVEIMRFLWKKSPARSAELVAELEDSCDWRPTTIKTLLARLTQKGAVKAAPIGRRNSRRLPL